MDIRKPAAGAAPKRRRAFNAAGKVKNRTSSSLEQQHLQRLLEHPGKRRARLPKSRAVELTTLVAEAPTGNEWLHEIKFDGYRMICRVAKGKARFISRNGHD